MANPTLPAKLNRGSAVGSSAVLGGCLVKLIKLSQIIARKSSALKLPGTRQSASFGKTPQRTNPSHSNLSPLIGAHELKNPARNEQSIRSSLPKTLNPPNDQKLSHAAGNSRQPEIRSEN